MNFAKPTAVAVFMLCTLGATTAWTAAKERKLNVKPLSLSFGKVQVGTISAPETITLSNRCGERLSIQAIEPPSGPFAVRASSCGSTLEQCGDCGISVTFNPTSATDPAGTTKTGELIVVSNATNSPQSVKLDGIAFGTAPAPKRPPTLKPMENAALPDALFVSNGNFVTTYPLGSKGDVEPIGTIDGAATGLANPSDIALDPRGNVYVVNTGEKPPWGVVTVYAAGSNGNADPIATIKGPNTGLNNAKAITVDSRGDIYVANEESGLGDGASITVYPAGSNGNVNPSATISGDNTHLQNLTGIAVDSRGNLYVAKDVIGGLILVFRPGSNGDVSPFATIGGPSTGLGQTSGMALDSIGNIYVTSNKMDRSGRFASTSITVFPAGSNGDAKPTAVISGPNTGLNSTHAITVDPKGNMYVLDWNKGGVIVVYAAGSNGNVKPMGVISGDDTGLTDPTGVAIGPYRSGPRLR